MRGKYFTFMMIFWMSLTSIFLGCSGGGGSGGSDGDNVDDRACNGLEYLCEMPFDEVLFPGNHNAGANAVLVTCDSRFPMTDCSYRNQGFRIKHALNYGIRYFDIDAAICGGELVTKHGTSLGNGIGEVVVGPSFSGMLDEFDTFLNLPWNQNEVVVITVGNGGNEPGVQQKLYVELNNRWSPTEERLARGDLTIYKKPPGDPWPKLGYLVDTNQRIVVFVNGALDEIKQTGALSLNDYVYDTWVEREVYTSCYGVWWDTFVKCSDAPNDKLVLVTVNGNRGICIRDMAGYCNRHIAQSLMSCWDAREHGKLIGPNFVIADWTDDRGDIVDDALWFNTMRLLDKGFPIAPIVYWSRPTSDENPPVECGKLISGISCHDSYCDQVSIQCAYSEYIIDETTAEWTGEFSDKFDPIRRICPEDKPYVTGVSCAGSYCDNMALQCSALENGEPRIEEDCYWTDFTISEEFNGNGLYEFPPSTYLAGMQCEGSYCDNLRLYLCEFPMQAN